MSNLDAFKSPTGWDSAGSTNAGRWEKENQQRPSAQRTDESTESYRTRLAASNGTK